jgi:hypothetical protein
MQPFGAVEKIKEDYQRFVETSFPLMDKAVFAAFQKLIRDEHLLWQEPYISLARPFLSGGTLAEAIHDGLLSSAILHDGSSSAPHWQFTRLYRHQRLAIERLTSLNHTPRNTIIATGTGSGKTESFLIPIIDHCLRHREPGVQAVIIYPMNALANDQLGRLQTLLKGTGVTFGRYTGTTKDTEGELESGTDFADEERTTRDAIQKDPPQILLTNYSMLEYLLVRKKDHKIFRHDPPKYLVLDEIHTYTGVLGAEVACLLRRFKEHVHLQLGRLCCIGTSATLIRKQDAPPDAPVAISSQLDQSLAGDSPAQELLNFASSLFGEPFESPEHSLIQEVYREIPTSQEPLHLWPTPDLSDAFFRDFDEEDEDKVRALAARFRLYPPQGVRGDVFFSALYHMMEHHPVFLKVEQLLQEPQSLMLLVDWLRTCPERAEVREEEDLKREAAAILLLGSIAYRINDDTHEPEPRFHPKVHLCVRSLTPLTMKLQSDDEVHLLKHGETTFTTDVHTGATHTTQAMSQTLAALPLAVCRSCGTHYLKGYYEQDEEVPLLSAPSGRGRGRHPGKKAQAQATKRLPDTLKLSADQPYKTTFQEIYVHLYRIHEQADEFDTENPDAAVADGEENDLTPTLKEARYYHVCPFCRIAHAEEKDAAFDPATFEHGTPDCPGKEQQLPRFYGFGKGTTCPRCGAQGHGTRDIITLTRGSAAISVSILAESLLPSLKESNKGNDGKRNEKKLLIFADSRQDTAHQAGYLRDRHQTFAQRQLTYRTVEAYEERQEHGIPLSILAQEVYKYAKNTWNSEVDALNLLASNPARVTELDRGLKRPDEHITKPERDAARDRLEWDLYIEFTQRANTRNSLEREGILTVQYADLEQIAREHIDRFAGYDFTASRADVQFLTTLLQIIMDYMRRQRAVDYKPFHDYLSSGADSVTDGTARPTRYTRTPQGFDEEPSQVAGAYKVFSWHRTKSSARVYTAIYDAVSRMFKGAYADEAVTKEKCTQCIDTAVKLLIEKGYIRKVRIGQHSGGSAQKTREAYQLAPSHMYVTTTKPGQLFRCDVCNDVRSYQVVQWRTRHNRNPMRICARYHCKGEPQPYHIQERNFYVHFYRKSKPERLYAVEHSGQLDGDERIRIEEGFKEGRINVIVCTQTLELGVDIGDLPAIILRNVPPTPSNYAQRAGRPGRRGRVALILTHAGQGPHDTYFFNHLQEMIRGAIRPPVFLIDNEVVIRRHINSLILEKLPIQLPSRWQKKTAKGQRNVQDDEWDTESEDAAPEGIIDEEGKIRSDWIENLIQAFKQNITQQQNDIIGAVKQAFVPQNGIDATSLSWLVDGSYVTKRCVSFVDDLHSGLEHWCNRYQEIYNEIARINRKVLLTATEERRRKILQGALRTLLDNREYQPLSYLAKVGFLPSYGFPGNTVIVRDDSEHQIAQVASVGVTEYALGNMVYVRGRKLQINRIHFKGGAHADPLQHAIPYKYCLTCSYCTEQETAQECPYCRQLLTNGQYVEYEMVHGWSNENITQDDEYRSQEGYNVAIYLSPLADAEKQEEYAASKGQEQKRIGNWSIRYHRLQRITLLNRGKVDPKTGRDIRFTVCLECGAWIRPRSLNEEDAERMGFRATGTDHLYSCSARADALSPYVQAVDLRVQVQGDVVEIELPDELPVQGELLEKWLVTLQEALKLGLQLEIFTKPGEIESFVATRWQDGKEKKILIFYDTMPGGTGYLSRFFEYLPRIAQRAYKHLFEDDRCETACYSCLKEFWNQRLHGLLDKRLIRGVLQELARG